ncbi:leucine-rich repeats and immunoglobulin-like domains protein 1 isoform X2 [Periplaneta americana]|uniref:leucine-rich repeats and immunoglobulin-like domains protein 1 isoform X2 n=1 Tax=Periplaneta americana TaxID=6978 RepID=UPI0037E90A65
MILLLLFWTTTAVTWTTVASDCYVRPSCSEPERCGPLSNNCSGESIPRLSNCYFSPYENIDTIKQLKINEANLSKIDNDFFLRKENLRYLNLSKNLLDLLDSEIFASLKNLIILDLSHNLLTYINSVLLSTQTKLRSLILSYNKLTTLNDSDLFSNQVELVRLDLSHNQIAFLTHNLFAPLTKLEDLALTGNKITQIDEWQLYPLLSLRKFYINENALLCNCEISHLVWLLDLKNVSNVEVTCRNSTTGNEISLFDADFDTFCNKPDFTTTKMVSDLLETEKVSWANITKDIIIYVLLIFIVIFILVFIFCKIKVCYHKALFFSRRLSTSYDDVLPDHEYYYEEVGVAANQFNIHSIPVTSNAPPVRLPLNPSTERSQNRDNVTVQNDDVGNDRISHINEYDYVTKGKTMFRNGDSAYIVPL